MTRIAVIAPGAMGAGIGKRLVGNGAEVLTVLDGRSAASVARAQAAGMAGAPESALADADVILSIIPPGEALALAERLAPVLAGAERKPVYADCNAVSPQTVRRIEAVIAPTGASFADAGIIGGPPREGEPGPVLYVCGPGADSVASLAGFGLRVTKLDGPVGAASGLKMSYAGITKGITALGAAMILAATRFGAAEHLRQELAASQAPLLARFGRAIPDMYSKAYRWVAEMQEIADFAEEDAPARALYQAMAEFYAQLAAENQAGGESIAALDAFLQPSALPDR